VRILEHLELSGLAVAVALIIAAPIALYLGHTGRGGFIAINVANIGRALPSLALLAFGLVIAIALGRVAALIAIALTWGLQRRSAGETRPPELQIQNIPHADRLDALPKDYAGLPQPKLGSPLGELNAPVVKAERNAGLDVMPPKADFHSNPEEDAARVVRLNREREAESASLAQVFFQLRNRPMEAKGVPAEVSSKEPAALTTDTASNASSPSSAQDRRQAFVDRPTDAHIYNAGSLQTPRSRWQLMAGTVIPAALVTGITSDLPGQVIATVTEPVYDSATGEALLIPQGTRLLGQYDAQVAFGQRRVLLVWTRLVMPDGSSIALDRTVASDVAGNAGLEDGVDRHWKRLLSGAVLSTLIGVGAELARPDDQANGNRVVISTRQSAQDTVNQVGQEITRRNLDIQPTLTIPPGYPVRVIVQHDLVLRPYDTNAAETSG
jgi:type IV secretion system protein VirB10